MLPVSYLVAGRRRVPRSSLILARAGLFAGNTKFARLFACSGFAPRFSAWDAGNGPLATGNCSIPGNSGYLRHLPMSISPVPFDLSAVPMKLASSAPNHRRGIRSPLARPKC